ncbi:hypothetical protein NDU88_003440 [Pleurodeles waltl]|uniref:Uncharacterized protein n=1 Tax=Pleurodeles waltl TaxID=8319 RepID=A0AAV7V1A8_PLEWA|nr:hypothetical protein NDU88_003440 [Pleurodeles waltl]
MRYRASGIVLFPEVRIARVRTRNTASSGIQTPQGIACLLLEMRYRASGIVLFPEVRIARVRTRNTASSGIQTPQGIACLLLEMRYRASGIVLFPEVRIARVRTRNTASSGIQTPQGIACLLLEVRVEGRSDSRLQSAASPGAHAGRIALSAPGAHTGPRSKWNNGPGTLVQTRTKNREFSRAGNIVLVTEET